MKSKLKKILSALLIFGVPVVVLIIAVNSGDLPQAMRVLRNANWGYICAGVACLFGFYVLGGISLMSSLKCQGIHQSFKEAFICSVSGEFYSNITPGASGGQPMKIYRMHKGGIPVGAATAATVAQFIAIQLMATVLTTTLGIIYWPFLYEQVNVNMPILIVGYSLNTLAALGVLFLSLFRKPVHFAINLVVKLCTALHIFKNPEEKRATFIHSANTFYDSMHLVLRRKGEIFRQLFICGVQLICSMSIVYFVNRSLGFKEHAFWLIVMMALMEYMSAAYAPMPGASGAREGVFSLYFWRIFPEASLLVGLLIWRFISFYLSLLVGVIVVTLDSLHRNKKISLEIPEESLHIMQE